MLQPTLRSSNLEHIRPYIHSYNAIILIAHTDIPYPSLPVSDTLSIGTDVAAVRGCEFAFTMPLRTRYLRAEGLTALWRYTMTHTTRRVG